MTSGNIVEPVAFDDSPSHKGNSIVLQPEEGDSYWQPAPASGYATIKVSPENCCSNFVSMGIQAIAEGGYVREHWHAKHEEILFCFEGEAEVLVDGIPHRFVPGTTVFVGRWVRHKITNTGLGYLKMTWTYLPPGLHEFMQSVGEPRKPGEPEPAQFARPADTVEIERKAGFGPKIGD
jgi:quercetin dioxygenase-like cupin family protein